MFEPFMIFIYTNPINYLLLPPPPPRLAPPRLALDDLELL